MGANAGRRQKWLLAGLAVTGFAYTLWLLLTRTVSVNLDGAMYMEGAQRLLEGGLPYIDFVDINPPLAYYLHTVPVLFSSLTGLVLTNSFLLLLLLCTLASSLASYALLTQEATANKARAAMVALTPALLLIPLQANFDLGQRPQLFALAALPYLITRLLRHQGTAPSPIAALCAGLLVGVMTCLKPFHYATLLASAELFLLCRYRRFDSLFAPEIYGAIAAAMAYGALLLMLPAESASAFYDVYLPLILDSYKAYASGSAGLLDKAGQYLTEPLMLALACAVLMRNEQQRNYRDLALLGGILATVGAALFWIQGKGWAYHAVPVWFGAYLAATCLVGRIAESISGSRLSRFVGATPLLIVLASTALVTSYATKEAAGAGKKKVKDYVSDVIREHSREGDTVYIMSTSVDAAYPLLPQLNRRQATRFPFLFPIPMLYDGAEPDAGLAHGYRIRPDRAQLEQDFLGILNTELEASQPSVILIERYEPCLFCPPEMTLPDYIEGHPTELNAFANYEHTGWTKRFKVMVLKGTTE